VSKTAKRGYSMGRLVTTLDAMIDLGRAADGHVELILGKSDAEAFDAAVKQIARIRSRAWAQLMKEYGD